MAEGLFGGVHVSSPLPAGKTCGTCNWPGRGRTSPYLSRLTTGVYTSTNLHGIVPQTVYSAPQGDRYAKERHPPVKEKVRVAAPARAPGTRPTTAQGGDGAGSCPQTVAPQASKTAFLQNLPCSDLLVPKRPRQHKPQDRPVR